MLEQIHFKDRPCWSETWKSLSGSVTQKTLSECWVNVTSNVHIDVNGFASSVRDTAFANVEEFGNDRNHTRGQLPAGVPQ